MRNVWFYLKRMICIILVFNLLFLSGCIEKKKKTEIKPRDFLVYNLGTIPRDLMLLDSNSLREKDLLFAVFEGLTREDEYGQIVPGLAEDWNVKSNDLEYTFKLRDEAYWSDGSKITAYDWVNFFQNILNRNTKNIFAEELYCIYGVKDYREGKTDFDNVAIRAIDKSTLQIRLNYPCAYFLNLLSQPYFTLRENNTYSYNWQKYYNKVKYSGPFTIKEVSSKGEIVLKKNDKYWGKENVLSQRVVMTSVPLSEDALALFERTQSMEDGKEQSIIDVFADPPISQTKRLIAEEKAITRPSERGINLTFNMKGIFSNNKELREIISYSIAENHTITNIGKELVTPAMSHVPKITQNMHGINYGEEFYRISNSKINFIDEKSEDYKKYINKNIKVIYREDYFIKSIGEEIAKDIKEYTGMKVYTEGYSEEELEKVIKNGDYDIVLSEYIGEYDDALAFLGMWTSNSKYNRFGYSNLDFDKIMYKLSITKGNAKRNELVMEGERILIEDIPTIPIYYFNTVICMQEYVKGVYTTKKGNLKFDRAYK